MKKFTFFATIALAMSMLSCGSSKHVANDGTIVEEDPVGNMVKEYTADGYKNQSMAYTMRESITKFRNKLQSNENLIEVISDGSGSSSFAAEMEALNAAAIKYAAQAGSTVRGGMEREFGSLGKDYDNFHGAFVQNVAKFIMPLMKAEMTFVKQSQNGYSVRIGYIIDEDKAREARHNAFDEALKDQAHGMVFGENVRKYIDEVVRPEE